MGVNITTTCECIVGWEVGCTLNYFGNGIYKITMNITRFAYVNILWIIFTILGLGILGFFPSTVAMFGVVRQWVVGEKEIDIFPLFWRTFRDEFKIANIIGYTLLIIGYLLVMEMKILRGTGELIYLIASFGVTALFILYFIALLYIFPIFVHFNLKIKDYFKWSLIIGIIHPILTIFLTVSLMVLYYITMQTMPALAFFFGGSFTAYIVTWGVSRTFFKYEASEIAEI